MRRLTCCTGALVAIKSVADAPVPSDTELPGVELSSFWVWRGWR